MRAFSKDSAVYRLSGMNPCSIRLSIGPKHVFACGKPSIFQMAASYAHGIVKNDPFLDGNKRAGFIAAALFIETNGYRFQALEEEAVLETLALAAGETSEEAYATWIEHASVPAN